LLRFFSLFHTIVPRGLSSFVVFVAYPLTACGHTSSHGYVLLIHTKTDTVVLLYRFHGLTSLLRLLKDNSVVIAFIVGRRHVIVLFICFATPLFTE
jgi:hypothetical protein